MRKCRHAFQCGGCSYQGMSYSDQLKIKQKKMARLLDRFRPVQSIIGMEDPLYYRNKVHHAFTKDRSGNIISGPYEAKSHWIIHVDDCMIEDKISQEIIHTIRKLLKSFRIKTYDEDTGYGVLRHVLIRRGFSTGEVMAVLVIGSRELPSGKAFVKALVEAHPEIKTVVLNYNDKKTSMILGEREKVLYGSGYIYDMLCGFKFRISSKSFYQVNPSQTEKLYDTAIRYAALKGNETVIDAYCGIGTIGIAASKYAGKVIGVELNPDAVKDAKINAKENNIENIEFYNEDAGVFMTKLAAKKEKIDVVFMDPTRSGSTVKFLSSLCRLKPEKIVYISCGPESLARDLKFLTGNGYICKKIQPFDMFPFTEHIENVALLSRNK
jgi:23S rRNA (uracil1939-C5)-methyltransferase